MKRVVIVRYVVLSAAPTAICVVYRFSVFRFAFNVMLGKKDIIVARRATNVALGDILSVVP